MQIFQPKIKKFEMQIVKCSCLVKIKRFLYKNQTGKIKTNFLVLKSKKTMKMKKFWFLISKKFREIKVYGHKLGYTTEKIIKISLLNIFLELKAQFNTRNKIIKKIAFQCKVLN